MDINYENICQIEEWQRQELEAVEAEIRSLRRYSGIKIKANEKSGGKYIYVKKPGDKDYKYYGKLEVNSSLVRNVQRLAHLKKQRELIRSNFARIENIIRNYKCTDYETVQSLLGKVYREPLENLNKSNDRYLPYGGLIHPGAAPQIIRWADELVEDCVEYPEYMIEEKKHRSECGIFTRSKSELIILNAMDKAKVNFFYEMPIMLGGAHILPDFTIYSERTGKTVFWEHHGMLRFNDYREKTIQKISTYMENGFHPGADLIITSDNADGGIDMRVVLAMIDGFIKK